MKTAMLAATNEPSAATTVATAETVFQSISMQLTLLHLSDDVIQARGRNVL
jgi:hypothetical protein